MTGRSCDFIVIVRLNMAATMRRAVESVTDIVFPASRSLTNVPQQHLLQRGKNISKGYF